MKERPLLKRKLPRKVETEKTKGNKCGKHEIEEEEFESLRVINKLASADKNKGECYSFGELITFRVKSSEPKAISSCKT